MISCYDLFIITVCSSILYQLLSCACSTSCSVFTSTRSIKLIFHTTHTPFCPTWLVHLVCYSNNILNREMRVCRKCGQVRVTNYIWNVKIYCLPINFDIKYFITWFKWMNCSVSFCEKKDEKYFKWIWHNCSSLSWPYKRMRRIVEILSMHSIEYLLRWMKLCSQKTTLGNMFTNFLLLWSKKHVDLARYMKNWRNYLQICKWNSYFHQSQIEIYFGCQTKLFEYFRRMLTILSVFDVGI